MAIGSKLKSEMVSLKSGRYFEDKQDLDNAKYGQFLFQSEYDRYKKLHWCSHNKEA